jgi:hypothetical protein
LWKPCSRDEFENIVKQLTKPELASGHLKMFCDLLTETIKSEKFHPTNGFEFDPCKQELPRLTQKQIKVLVLLDALAETEVMAEVCSYYANYLFYALFGVGRIYNMAQYCSVNMVRFYLTLLRQSGLEELCRLFLFDMMFFKNSRNHVFVCVLIEVWPAILTWPYRNHTPLPESTFVDPIVDTVVWMVNNTGPASSLKDLRVYEARNWLVEYCQVRFQAQNGTDLVKKLIAQVKAHPADEVLKTSTTMSLLLLAKWQEYRWTNNNMVNRLLEVLSVNLEQEGTEAKGLLQWVLDTIGLVSIYSGLTELLPISYTILIRL